MEKTQTSIPDQKKFILNSLIKVAGALTALGGIIALGGYGIYYSQKQIAKEALAERKQAENRTQEDSKWKNYFNIEYVESQKPIYATVIEERAGMRLINDNKTITGHESLEINKKASAYVIKVKTDQYIDHGTNSVPSHVIALNIVDGVGMTKETLEALLTNGSRISFPRGSMVKFGNSESWHNIGDLTRYGYIQRDGDWLKPETQGGTKPAGQIKVLSSPLEQE